MRTDYTYVHAHFNIICTLKILSWTRIQNLWTWTQLHHCCSSDYTWIILQVFRSQSHVLCASTQQQPIWWPFV